MLNDLLIHPRTRAQLEHFIASPSHGLLLSGPEGSGKRTLANAVSAGLLGVTRTKLIIHPYYSLTDPAETVITIEELRTLQRLLTLKTPKSEGSSIHRVLTIIDANRLRTEAQNAFLKNLEEPPTDTCIILTANSAGDLLSTILSRVQHITILPVSLDMAQEYYKTRGIPATVLQKNYALSQGQVGLLDSLLQSETDHPLKEWVDKAKILLSKQPGERILQTDELSKDKPGILMLLNALGRIVHAAMVSASNQGNSSAIKRWQNSLNVIQETHEAIKHNANTKLLLDNLLLNI